MSDIDKRLDEILKNQGNIIPDSYDMFETKQAIKQLMADEFEKMIGEDDKYIEGYHTVPQEEINACNELRDKLRQKLEEWKK